jgi:hypothetical protein
MTRDDSPFQVVRSNGTDEVLAPAMSLLIERSRSTHELGAALPIRSSAAVAGREPAFARAVS